MKYLFGTLLILVSVGLFAQDQEEFARPDLPGELMVDIGFSLWSETVSDLEQDLWPSKSVSIYYLKSKKLNDKFRFNYGVGLSLDKIGFKTNVDSISSSSDFMALTRDTLGVAQFNSVVANTDRVSFDKYSLKNTFLEIPLELRFHPKGSEAGEGFFVSAGGILGVRLKSKDKLVYQLNGEKYITKESGDFGASDFRFGVQARLGFKGIHFFYKQYLNNVFKDDMPVKTFNDQNGQTFNPTLTTIGINFTGF